MNVQIVGTMLDPSGGEPAGGAMIQFIALAQYGGVPKGARSTQTTSATGEYNFPLNYGRYSLSINHSGRFVNQAVSVTVNDESPSVMDIDLLLQSSVPLTPPEFKYLEELLAKAEQAADYAEGFASDAAYQVSLAEGEVVKATNQANIATIEANRAKTEADKASEVSGLDTVEQAVDMALGEFAGIMTESEARSTNRINKAKYDASGMVNNGKHGANNINEGLYVDGATPDALFLGGGSNGSSETDYAVFNIAGAVINAIHSNNQFKFEMPPAEDGKRTYNKSTGESITHPDVATAFALAGSDVNIDVVTHRVDLPAVEYFEEETTGEVMDCIQSTSTTFGNTDVPTVLSTRKLSYFQQYEGQFPEVTADPDFINDRYRCVVWTSLTDEQKRKVAAYMGEKLFMGVNGNIVNGRLRALTIRGAGNGDFGVIDSTNPGWARFDDKNYLTAQGMRDKPVGYVSSGFPRLAGLPSGQMEVNDNGVFQALETGRKGDTSAAYQGRCFVYVVATVPRPNQGAYHPDLNSYGTAVFRNNSVTDGSSWYNPWYNKWSIALGIHSAEDCFNKLNTDGSTGINGGDIASGRSGHPDGIYFDGIEADGLSGVIDWRLGAVANDSPEEAAKVEAKVENSTYRGLEKLVWTTPRDDIGTGTHSSASRLWDVSSSGVFTVFNEMSGKDLAVGDTFYVYDATANFVVKGVVSALYSNAFQSEVWGAVIGTRPANSTNGTGNTVVYLTEQETNLSVSGEFNTQIVIGDPANILLTDALKDGWLGTWCPVIPDGTSKEYTLTRKCLDSSISVIYSVNNGATWAKTNQGGFDAQKNSATAIKGSNEINVIPYKAFAKQTKESTNKPVYNAKAGLIGVTVTQSHDKAVLAEAVAGIILKSDASGIVTEQSSPVKFLVNEVIERVTSLATDMVTPTNDSQAIKIAVYQISENGQVSLGFIANTMTYNGTDWGELDEIIIPFGDLDIDTFNDANGVSQLAYSTMTAIPFSWTSNHARAGKQVPGVDL